MVAFLLTTTNRRFHEKRQGYLEEGSICRCTLVIVYDSPVWTDKKEVSK